MARMRKGVAYRSIERPNTRISKFRKLAYVRMDPHVKIARFELGDSNKKFEVTLNLVSKAPVQVRQESLEAARQTTTRLLEKSLTKSDYFMKLRVYPYHILRENPLAAGAGADRMSTGMQRSFGKPIGIAAQVRKGQTVMSLGISKANIALGRKALHRAATKMPCSFTIVEA